MYRDPYIVLGHSRTLRSAIGNLAHFFSPTKSRIYAHLRELIEEMNVEIPTESEQPPEQSTPGQPGMAIVPFMGEGDEIVGSVIGRLLAAEGIGTTLVSWRTLRAEKVERLKELKAPWILLSAMESRSVTTLGITCFAQVAPQIVEALLIPFQVGGKAVGTVWVISHTRVGDSTRKTIA